jgi:hypothetical protein
MCKDKALYRLGYTEEWLSFGILTEDYLLSQYQEILTSEDQNAEHYRSGGFGDYLKSKKVLTDQEVENVFKLVDDGPDKYDLHQDRIINLVVEGILTGKQLVLIGEYPEVVESPIQKCYLREILIRKIDSSSTDECFESIKSTDDTAIHEYILNKIDLLPKHAVWLSENGGNKRVRNIARQLCNKKSFMKNA